jgi:thiamine biosynthesis lipoprotein
LANQLVRIDRQNVRLVLILSALLSALAVHRLYLSNTTHPESVLVVRGETMGTKWEISVAGSDLGGSLREQIERETSRRLNEIDRWMSNWNPNSEISRFNAYRETNDFPVSDELAALVGYAVEVSRISGGAFDCTVGPLVAYWGFGSGARVDHRPFDEEIEKLMRHVSSRDIRAGLDNDTHGGFLRKVDPESEIDLSAIAKGYGVDHVAAGLRALDRNDFLVEIGGEVRASGERPGGGPWRLAIEKPLDEGRAIHGVVELKDQAMATSGDYRTFYFEENKRISHTIDPRTGRPVDNDTASVTVIAPTATIADAWATALMVLGPDPGLALATQQNLGAMLLVRETDGTISPHRNELFPASSALIAIGAATK